MSILGLQDWRQRLPYWTCNGQVFKTKLSALMHATQIKSDIEFRFNDEFLDQLDWSKEPPLHIDEYYKLRAQSIRDNYDYVLVMYSGGSDSSTIVKTFLRNNISVDEVAIYGVWNHKIDKYNSSTNLETTYAGWPLLEKVSACGTKVTHINLADAVEISLSDPDWIYQSDPAFTANQACRFHSLFQRPDLIAMREKGKKVALVVGHDKARVVTHHKSFYHGFLDLAGLGTWIHPQIFYPDYVGPDLVTFYCNIDVPEIMIKQSHMIASWYWNTFHTKCESLLNLSYVEPRYSSRANIIMYPTTWREHETYTLGKAEHLKIHSWAFRSEWLYKDLGDTEYYNNWLTGVKTAFGLVDDRFIKPNKKGLKGHWSKLRKIIDFPEISHL